jgi:hypothetical protein
LEDSEADFMEKANRKGNKFVSKNGKYYYNRMPPSHSSIPANINDISQGPPIQAAPYYYLNDTNLNFRSGGKNTNVVTTLDRPSGDSAKKMITRVATSPLKSCIQNAEVKIARGGVAVSFDPWKSDKKKSETRVRK